MQLRGLSARVECWVVMATALHYLAAKVVGNKNKTSIPYASRTLQTILLNPHMGASGLPCMCTSNP